MYFSYNFIFQTTLTTMITTKTAVTLPFYELFLHFPQKNVLLPSLKS
jgi:hypothetical protein